MKDRIHKRHLKALLSDESDPDSELEDYKPGIPLDKLKVDLTEFTYAKA